MFQVVSGLVKIYRFTGVRPDRPAAQEIAAVPYDVVTAEEARAIIGKKPTEFPARQPAGCGNARDSRG